MSLPTDVSGFWITFRKKAIVNLNLLSSEEYPITVKF